MEGWSSSPEASADQFQEGAVSRVERPSAYIEISDSDKQIIRAGLAKLDHEYFRELAPEQYPGVIIYPDTSARTLRFAVHPLMELRYKERGLSLPRERFVALSNNAKIREDYDFPEDDSEEGWDRFDREKEAEYERFCAAAEPFNNWAKDIVKNVPEGGRILIVDELVSAEMLTINSLREYLRSERRDIRVDAFAFLGGDVAASFDDEEDHLDFMDGEGTGHSEENVLIGTYRYINLGRVSFESKPLNMDLRGDDRQKKYAGIEKGDDPTSPYSRLLPSDERNTADMQRRRDDMLLLGQEYLTSEGV